MPRVALAAALVLAVAGIAWAAGGGDDAGDSADTAGLGASAVLPDGGAQPEEDDTGSGADPTAGLSAEELDRLRQDEIEELKRFTRRKANRDLPVPQRRRAARKVSDLIKLAQARQRAAERRELALRRALAREREARARERARHRSEESSQPAPAEQRDEPADRGEPTRREPQPSDEPDRSGDDDRDRDQAEAECLYDAGSGTYICPE